MNEVWDYDLRTRERSLRKRQEVPSGHDPAAYVTRRTVRFLAKDDLFRSSFGRKLFDALVRKVHRLDPSYLD